MYNPWGEEMHQWNANTYAFTSPYRFNSKELDPETGLAYYGARYYQNKMGVWLSVDPKSYWYQSQSPYVFTLNNPIMLHDPNGQWVEGGGWLNNVLFSDDKVVSIMAKNYAKNTGGSVSKIDGGYRVLDPPSYSNKELSFEESNDLGEVGFKDYYTDRLSKEEPRLGSLGIGVNFEIVYPGNLFPNGKPVGYGGSIDLMADANNNLNLLATSKTPDESIINQFGFTLDIQFSFTTETGKNPNPLNENLIGRGSEWGGRFGSFWL
jgi:RHS repeat-associated protein